MVTTVLAIAVVLNAAATLTLSITVVRHLTADRSTR